MSEKNRVLSAYKAVVDGKTTALAGCNTANCERQCLRKDPSLRCRESWKPDICSAFIPIFSQ